MLLALLALQNPAAAQTPVEPAPRQSETHLDGLLLTRVPVVAGAGAVFEGPGRVRLGASGGFLPQRYADLVSEVARDLNAWDATTSYVVNQILPGSASLRAEIGWRPVPWKDFTVSAGYQLLHVAGQVDPYKLGQELEDLEQIEGLEGLSEEEEESLESLDALELSQIGVTANLHQVCMELGYQWYSPENVILRVTAGASVTLGARSAVRMDDIVYEDQTIDTEVYRREAIETLDQTLRSYFHTPTIGLSIGYRFL